MKLHYLPCSVYNDIWMSLESRRNGYISFELVDRWLSIYHGLTAVALDHDYIKRGYYSFEIRDEEKLILFLLRWT